MTCATACASNLHKTFVVGCTTVTCVDAPVTLFSTLLYVMQGPLTQSSTDLEATEVAQACADTVTNHHAANMAAPIDKGHIWEMSPEAQVLSYCQRALVFQPTWYIRHIKIH